MIHHKTIHFPIALILVGSVIELVAVLIRREQLAHLAGIFLWLGVGGLMAAVGTGLWVEESFGDARIPTHRNWGLAALGAGVVALVCHCLRFSWARWGRALFFGLAAVFVVVTGQMGGEMGHGDTAPPPRRAQQTLPDGAAKDASSGAQTIPGESDDGEILLPPPARLKPRSKPPLRTR